MTASITKTVLLSALLASASLMNAQMNGTYTLGPSGSHDFNSFNEAVLNLEASGVNGPTVILVASGTYNEQVEINEIAGASATNTIDFIAADGVPGAAFLSHSSSNSSTDNYTLALNSTDHIRFTYIGFERPGGGAFGRILLCSAGPGTDLVGVVVDQCLFKGNQDPNNTTNSEAIFIQSTSLSQTELTVVGCTINGGSMGLYSNSINGGDVELSITDNTMESVRNGIYSVGNVNDGLEITDNIIVCNGTSPIGIGVSNHNASALIAGNSIKQTSSGWGIYMQNCTPSSSSAKISVVNNSVICLTPSSGDGLYVIGSRYIDLINNSVYMSTGVPFRFLNAASPASCKLVNNILSTGGSPALVHSSTQALSSGSFNLFHSASSPNIIQWQGTLYTLPSIQPVTGIFTNCKNDDPKFEDPNNDLHIRCSSLAVNGAVAWSGVSTDIDGNSRPQFGTADIGCDEKDELGLSGTIYIGPSIFSRFNSFTEAIDHLVECGVSGPVVFNVESGTYTEQLTIPAILGVSATNTITFQSFTQDSTDVVLEWPSSTSSFNNHLVLLNGASFITFKHLTLQRTGSSFRGRILFMLNGSHDVGLSNSKVRSSHSFTSALDGDVMTIFGAFDIGSTTCMNNDLGFTTGIKITGATSGHFQMLQNEGLYLKRAVELDGVHCKVSIEENDLLITDPNSATFGIKAYGQSTGELQIRRNLIRTIGTTDATILELEDLPWDGVLNSHGFIVNNFFYMDQGCTSCTGIAVKNGVSHLFVFHNTVRAITSNAIPFVQTGSSGSNIALRNNIFSGMPISMTVNDPARMDVDHNMYDREGSTVAGFVIWNGVYHSQIATLNNASGQDANSLMGDALYSSPSAISASIRNTSPCMEAGAMLTGVSVDRQGDPRPVPAGTSPEIGADEFVVNKEAQIRVMLEGPYDTSSDQMNDDLRSSGYIPATEPYTALGYSWVTGGGEVASPSVLAATGNLAVVDWVMIQLKDKATGTIVEQDIAGLVRRDGYILAPDGGVITFPGYGQEHYITVLHRNHLSVTTAAPQFIWLANIIDLSDGSIPAYGVDPMKIDGSTHLMWAGDVNFNGTVQYTGSGNDRDPILQEIGGSVPTNTTSGYKQEDVNMDGTVKYTGPGNDRDPILVNIGGSVPTNTRHEQLP